MLRKLEREISKVLKLRTDRDDTVWEYVVRSVNTVFARQSKAAGCNAGTKNNEENPPLALPNEENQLEMVKFLLKLEDNYYKNLFLWFASYFDCPEFIKLLIEFGADVNTFNEEQLITPLHCACMCEDENKSVRIVRTLVEAGADVNAVTDKGWSPLAFSLKYKLNAVIELLVAFGASINIDKEIVVEFLDDNVYPHNLEIFSRLIKLGYDVNTLYDEGETILYFAASRLQSEIVKLLLTNGAMMKVAYDGYEPLSNMLQFCEFQYEGLSARSDDQDKEIESGNNRKEYIEQLKCIELLIKHGANVNQVANDGMTSLYIVLNDYSSLHSNFVRILLKNGANFDFDHPSVKKVFCSNSSNFPHLLLRHTAVFHAQNRTDGPSNFNLNNLNLMSRKDYVNCRDQLESMKSTKVGDTTVSFFDILVKKDISSYMRNESIRSVFEKKYFIYSFPVFFDLLCERFAEGIEFENLMEKAASGLGYVLNWERNSSHLPLKNILSKIYFATWTKRI